MDHAEDWRSAAACGPEDGKSLFPPAEYPVQPLQEAWEPAREICRKCPVRRDCLADALTREFGLDLAERYGMAGGTTPRERYAMEREWRSGAWDQ